VKGDEEDENEILIKLNRFDYFEEVFRKFLKIN
jgi:hypothetical protein